MLKYFKNVAFIYTKFTLSLYSSLKLSFRIKVTTLLGSTELEELANKTHSEDI